MSGETKILIILEACYINIGTDLEGCRFYLKIGASESTLFARTINSRKAYFEAFGEWATKLKNEYFHQGCPLESPLEYDIHCTNGPRDSLTIPDEHFKVVLGIMVALFEVETKDLVIGQSATDLASEVV